MDKLLESLRHPDVLAVSLQLLILYCVSVGLFFAVDTGNRAASDSMRDGLRSGNASSQLLLFAVAAVSNSLAVLTFIFLSKKLNTTPRLAMVGLPLLLIVEKHVRAIRADKADHANRRPELLLAAGVTVGIIGAAIALMRHCPIK